MNSHQAVYQPRILELLERRVLFADGFLDVTIGDGAAKSVRFVDADGTVARIMLRSGSAVLRLTGDGLNQATERRDTVVSGNGVAVAAVTVTGTSPRTSLAFDGAGGDGRVTVVDIATDGPMKFIDGRDAVLTGSLTTGGTTRRVEFRSTRNAQINLGGGAGTASVAIREDAVDTNLTSAAPIRRLSLFTWTGFDPGDTITAPSIGRMTAEVFRGDIDAGSIGTLDLGSVETANINLTGSLGQLRGQTAANSIVNVAGDIGRVAFLYMGRTRIYAGVRPLPEESPAPSSVADFVGASSIRRLQLRATDVSGAVVIAARTLRAISLRQIRLGFGTDVVLAADRILGGTAQTYDDIKSPRRTQRIPRLDNEVRTVGSVEFRAL